MIERDVDIFNVRPIFYASYFILGSLIPCIVLGFVGISVQFLSQIKIINTEEKLINKELKAELKKELGK